MPKGKTMGRYVNQVANCIPSVRSGDIAAQRKTDENWDGKFTVLVADHYESCVSNDTATIAAVRDEIFIRKQALQCLDALVPAIDDHNGRAAWIILVVSSVLLVVIGFLLSLLSLPQEETQPSGKLEKDLAKMKKAIAALQKTGG